MTPAKLNLTIYQGATWKRILRVSDAAQTPIDLTGATVRMDIRATIADETPILTLNETNGRAVVSDAAAGEVTLLVSDEDTAELDFISAVYDLEIAYNNGTVDRVIYGTVKLSKEVTRS